MLLLMIPSAEAAAKDSALTALEDKLAQATSNRELAEAAVEAAKASYADAMTSKQAIDKKILSLELEIEALSMLIEGYEKEIANKNDAIAKEEARLAEKYETVRTRIRQKREDGSGDFITVLLDSDGLKTFFSNIDRFEQLLSYDTTLLDSYKNGITALEEMRDSIEYDRIRTTEQRQIMQQRHYELERDQKSANQLIASAQSDITTATSDLERLIKIEEEYAAARAEKLKELQATSNNRYVGGEFLWPLPESYQQISSPWGWRIHPVTGKQQFHNGIDIPAPYGTQIFAVNDGTVVECSYNYADGYYITINHGGGIASFYSHLSRYYVKVGDKVKRGQVIANVGTSGYTTGPHLNLNVYKDGSSVNPLTYFG